MGILSLVADKLTQRFGSKAFDQRMVKKDDLDSSFATRMVRREIETLEPAVLATLIAETSEGKARLLSMAVECVVGHMETLAVMDTDPYVVHRRSRQQ